MKKMVYLLLFLSIIKLISGQCFSENPENTNACEKKKRNGYHCCYTKYRTLDNPEYKTVCLEIIHEDIKAGHHEQTIINIESGNYTGSNWTQNVIDKFKPYVSINTFDCKGSFLSRSLIFLISLLIISLF